MKNLATLIPEKLQGFYGILLYHCHALTHVNVYSFIFIRVTWLIHMWHDSCIRDMTRLYMMWLSGALRGRRGCGTAYRWQGCHSFVLPQWCACQLRWSHGMCVADCCRLLQCVAVCCSPLPLFWTTSMTCLSTAVVARCVCCSLLQSVAVCCSLLQSVAVCCSLLQSAAALLNYFNCVPVNCGGRTVCVLQSVAVCCSALQQCVAACCSVLQCVAVRCSSVLQCVAVLCSVVQCGSVWWSLLPLFCATSMTCLWAVVVAQYVSCSLLQSVAVCCSLLQSVAVFCYSSVLPELRACELRLSHGISHISMSHVTRMNESCHTYEWVMSHIPMSHVAHMNESFHAYEWVMSHISMSHITHMNVSCHTYLWIYVTHMNKSCHTHMNESCHTYECVMSHIWMSHVTHNGWVMSHLWMSHVTHINESCHTYEWVMSHMNESYHTHEWVMSHIWMSHVTHMNE